MMPGMNGLDPKKMNAIMKQLGMKQEDIASSRVIIEKEDGGRIIINNPSVTKISMQGQESWQITGDAREETIKVEISKEDIKTIMQKTGCSEKQAKSALEKTGDLAEAILELSE